MVVVDHGPPNALWNGPLFESVQKVYTYGSVSVFDHQTASYKRAVRNSWQGVFWDHRVRYAEHGSTSNCEFTRAFRQVAGTPPDFHAAFIFSSLEVAEALQGRNPFATSDLSRDLDPIATIFGPMHWNATGRREGAYPIVMHTDALGQAEIFALATSLEWCADAKQVASFPITRWDPPRDLH